MRVKFFAVPAADPGAVEQEVNRFLGGHRVLSIDRELVAESSGAFWALCITYLQGPESAAKPKRGKIDYREVLPEAEFSIFAKLRSLRKSLAAEEAVPAYALFTNEQLATMVRQRIRTAQQLSEIPGVGQARVEKYGPAFLEVLAREIPKLSERGTRGSGEEQDA